MFRNCKTLIMLPSYTLKFPAAKDSRTETMKKITFQQGHSHFQMVNYENDGSSNAQWNVRQFKSGTPETVLAPTYQIETKEKEKETMSCQVYGEEGEMVDIASWVYNGMAMEERLDKDRDTCMEMSSLYLTN